MNADVVVRPSPVDAWASARTAGRQRSPLCQATLGMAASSLRNSVARQRASSSAPTVRFAESVAAASPGVRPASRPAVYPTALLRQIQRRRSRRRQEKLLAIGRLKARASSAEKSKLEAKKEVKSKVMATVDFLTRSWCDFFNTLGVADKGRTPARLPIIDRAVTYNGKCAV